ncbi:hypothetical protein BKA62DRAFT_688803 [Auriculariales sp. MPI-PUGE-AT-0066]|nr:hypothetical protein BKA62DRAFT_688803 [Auriculariales sp. MPI-PUGE-AT-0066]
MPPHEDEPTGQDHDIEFSTTNDDHHARLARPQISEDMESEHSRQHRAFLDRFQNFMIQQEHAIVSFAAREAKPVIAIRRMVALAHSKVVFGEEFLTALPNQSSHEHHHPTNGMPVEMIALAEETRVAAHSKTLVAPAGFDPMLARTVLGKLRGTYYETHHS